VGVCSGAGPKLGVGAKTLRKWIMKAQVDAGDRSGPNSQELEEIRRLKAEVRDLKEANEILRAATVFFMSGNSTLANADRGVHRRSA
jgi:transposase